MHLPAAGREKQAGAEIRRAGVQDNEEGLVTGMKQQRNVSCQRSQGRWSAYMIRLSEITIARCYQRLRGGTGHRFTRGRPGVLTEFSRTEDNFDGLLTTSRPAFAEGEAVHGFYDHTINIKPNGLP